MPKKVEVSGRFYFNKTDNGNLIGEFSNNHHTDRPSTESADLIGNDPDPSNHFIGIYHSTWQENGVACFARLEISPKGQSKKLFTLQWSNKEKLIFEGEGMIGNGVLIGNYWFCQ